MHERIKESLTIAELDSKLQNAGIDTSKFGIDNAKTLEHLKKEIDEGETTLTTNESGEITRKVTVGGTDIYHITADGKKYKLIEDRQVFADGRERKRNMEVSVSEKLKLNENPGEAMVRGIREELGLPGDISLTEKGTDSWSDSKQSYPGLKTEYTRHRFELILNEEQYKPDGYVEVQDHLSTYFVWEEVRG